MPSAEARRLLFWLPLGWLVFVVVVAAFAPLIGIADPGSIDWGSIQMPPGAEGHLLGTDVLGRDMLEGLPQMKDYIKMLRARPAFARVDEDRKTASAAMAAAAKKS